jgi:hypothetical protein
VVIGFGAFALRHLLPLGDVSGGAVTESHGAAVVLLIELNLELAAIPAGL